MLGLVDAVVAFVVASGYLLHCDASLRCAQVLAAKLGALESRSPFVVICWWLTCLKVSLSTFPRCLLKLDQFY
jgi:hypothetical protein